MSELTVVDILRVLLFGYPLSAEFIDRSYPVFLQASGGLVLTLIISVLSFSCGMILATLFASLLELERKPIKRFSWIGTLVSVLQIGIRGILYVCQSLPILILVLLFYYLPYPLFGLRVPAVLLGIGAFSLYAAVYLTQIFRSGFRSVPQGLTESSRILGLNHFQIFTTIKLPCALRVMIPAIVGVAITVFKDTSVLMAAGVAELTFTSRQLSAASPGHYSVVLFLVIALYWAIASLFSWWARSIEKKVTIYGWGGSV